MNKNTTSMAVFDFIATASYVSMYAAIANCNFLIGKDYNYVLLDSSLHYIISLLSV